MRSMTAVPTSFDAEPGSIRCGNSFERTIVVTGEIPGRNGYGANHKHTIGRIALQPSGTWWSKKDPKEAAFISQITTRMQSVQNDINLNRAALSQADIASLEWLLELAANNLARVEAIYTYWTGFGAHPETGESLPADQNAPNGFGGTMARASEWPLTASDAIYEYLGECQGQSARWVDDRELVGGTTQHMRYYFCPGDQTRAQRARDRSQILKLLLDAARAVRCAQYGVWRIVLYKRAVADWNAQYGGTPDIASPTQPGTQPRPGVVGGQGGFQYQPVDPIGPLRPTNDGGLEPGPVAPIPPTPVDWIPPDPGDLPQPGGPGPLGGSDSPTDTDNRGDAGGGASSKIPIGPIAAVAVGLTAVHFLLKGTR
jgi:hypothetical protein